MLKGSLVKIWHVNQGSDRDNDFGWNRMTENEYMWLTLTNLLRIPSWTPKDLGLKDLFLFGLKLF